MFNFAWGEIVVIGIVALIAIGPKELPTVLRSIGQFMGKIRRMANEFQGQFQEALREAELSDLQKQASDFKNSITNYDPLADTQKDIERFTNHDPLATTAEIKPLTSTGEPPEIHTAPAPSALPTPDGHAPMIDVPLPEAPPPVTNADFAPAEPAPPETAAVEPPAAKQAGGSA
ncbi:MAG: Sec-independent protein translocase protein TatB [Pseudolabrys sp.]|nr:Sec-independent protein translocase protein TatB [Pseudolabrys sp.]